MVAPHAGAWIETGADAEGADAGGVAPHAGTWIETFSIFGRARQSLSPLTQGRG